jgi:hypothetical protein
MATCPRQFPGEGIPADDRSAGTGAAECGSARGVAEQRDPAGGPTGHRYAADRIEVDVGGGRECVHELRHVPALSAIDTAAQQAALSIAVAP